MKTYLKDHFSEMAEKAEKIRKQSNSALKKTIIATLVVSTISMNTAFAADNKKMASQPKLQKIYHVYVNNEYIGTVSNKEMVENLVNEKVNQAREIYKDYELSLITDEVSFVPEQIFRESHNQDEKVLQMIDDQVAITAEAVALKIDGEIVTYLENQDKVDELIKKLKLKYVSEEDLKSVEARKQSGEELPPLSEGESRILDVYLSKNVTISLEEVDPEKVLPVNKAIDLLLKGTLTEQKYVVQEGDVLGAIAAKHGLTLKQLLDLNPDYTEETILHIGDELNVTAYKPFIDVVVEKEVSKVVEIPYETKTVDNSSMFKGESKVVQQGANGQKAISYRISQVNGSEVKRDVTEEKVLKEPVERIVHRGTKVIPSRGTGSLVWPTNGGYISSYQGMRWGRYHKGIDIARPSDYTIKAADNGVVIAAGWYAGYGNRIVIDHKNGMRTLYAHLSSINVSVGQVVAAGQKIGVMGSTGNSTGTHLHFEVYVNGVLKNPLSYY